MHSVQSAESSALANGVTYVEITEKDDVAAAGTHDKSVDLQIEKLEKVNDNK